MGKGPRVVLGLRIESDLKEVAEYAAKISHQTLSEFVRDAVIMRSYGLLSSKTDIDLPEKVQDFLKEIDEGLEEIDRIIREKRIGERN